MENEKTIKDYISTITKPIFDRALQETKLNRVSVGRSVIKKSDYFFYSPHNLRLYFDFDKTSLRLPKPTSQKGRFIYKIKNGSEHFFSKKSFNITIKQKVVEIQNKREYKKEYKIFLSSGSQRIERIWLKKYRECVVELKKFIGLFGGSSEFRLLNHSSEDAVTHEDFIDKLDIKSKWHTKTHKKVYNEKKVEFFSPVFASNYIDNQSLRKHSPELVSAIYSLNPLRALKQNVRVVSDVLRFDGLVRLLSEDERLEFTDWLFLNMEVE